MHFRLVTTSSWTAANFSADLQILITGGSLSSTSAGINKTSSSSSGTIAPGWTCVDSALSFNGRMYECKDKDGRSKFVGVNCTTANLGMFTQNSWSAGTGTDQGSGQVIPVTEGTIYTYDLIVTPRMIFIMRGNNTCLVHMEIERLNPLYMTKDYPTQVVATQAAFANGSGAQGKLFGSRRKNVAAAGDQTGANAVYSFGHATIIGGTVASVQPNTTLSASGTAHYEVQPIFVMVFGPEITAANRPSFAGRIIDVFRMPPVTSGATADTFSIGTDTYIAFLLDNTGPAYCIKKD